MNKPLVIGAAVIALALVGAGAFLASCVSTVPAGSGSVDEAGVARDPGQILMVGDTAPAFDVKDHNGNDVKLADFRGKKAVVMIIYPGDETPGCTKQLCTARDDFKRYEDAGAVVLGVNPADALSHAKFASNHNFQFPILVDSDGQVIRAYGARGVAGIAIRTVYVVGKDGKIAFAERGMPSTDAILASIKG